jgi:hypothetical protein
MQEIAQKFDDYPGGGSMTWPAAAGVMVYGGSSAYGTSLVADGDAIGELIVVHDDGDSNPVLPFAISYNDLEDLPTITATQAGVHSTPSTTTPLAPTWTSPMHTVWYGTTGEIDLPAASGYAGRGILIYNTGAYTITVDPNSSEIIVKDGTALSGGTALTLSSGAGNHVALFCDGARWVTLGFKGTLVNNSSGASSVNPSFINALSWRSGGSLYGYDEQWLFCCGYIFPSTTSNTATTYSGIYNQRGTKIYSGIDYRWSTNPSPWAGESVSQSNEESNVIYFARPSLYLCDEYEPNIKRMIGL